MELVYYYTYVHKLKVEIWSFLEIKLYIIENKSIKIIIIPIKIECNY